MRSANRSRALISSGAAILLCAVAIIGMTFALFTDTQNVNHHLRAGDMSITLRRAELVKTALDSTGKLVESKVQSATDPAVDFTDTDDDNVFGIVDGEKLVPGSKYVATMQIANESDVAFKYWIKVECNDADVEKQLADQLLINVYTDKNRDGVINIDSESDEGTVAKGVFVGSANDYIGMLGINESDTFIVSVEFVDKGYGYENGVLTSENDGAKKDLVGFDLVVYAVQVAAAPTP